MAKTPHLSVVVVALIGHDALANCLDRLPLDAVECIVVLTEEMRPASQWKRRYNSVVFVEAIQEPVPLRRQRGVKAATGDVVGLIEDTSWPDEGWCAAVRSAFEDSQIIAAGGPVRIAPTLRSRCQALGWSDYGSFAPNRAQQSTTSRDRPVTTNLVPGNNMAFRHCALLELLQREESGLIEGPICAQILAKGGQILYQPEMTVTLSACDRHSTLLATRLHHGRIYAGMQLKDSGWISRLLHLAKASVLPIVLTARAWIAMSKSNRANARLSVLFWLGLMTSAWALGEAVGSLRGVGRSMNEWR